MEMTIQRLLRIRSEPAEQGSVVETLVVQAEGGRSYEIDIHEVDENQGRYGYTVYRQQGEGLVVVEDAYYVGTQAQAREEALAVVMGAEDSAATE